MFVMPHTSQIVGTTTSEARELIAGRYGRGGGALGEPLSLDRQTKEQAMSSRSSGWASRPVAISLCLMLLAVSVADLAATARASGQALVPENLRILSASPNRYPDHFTATFTTPPAAAWAQR